MKTLNQYFRLNSLNSKKITLSIFIFLGTTLFVFSQKDSITTYHKNTYKDPLREYFKKVDFRIGGGVLIPQSGLKDFFGNSPMIELGAVFPLKRKKSLELAVQFVIPNQKKSFQYITVLDTINAKATFIFNPMLRFRKHLVSNYKSDLNISLGIGASILQTNARNPFYEGKKDDNKYEIVTAFLASPGIEYTHKFANKEHISIGLSFQYSPYKIEGALQEDIGSFFYVPRIAYRF